MYYKYADVLSRGSLFPSTVVCIRLFLQLSVLTPGESERSEGPPRSFRSFFSFARRIFFFRPRQEPVCRLAFHFCSEVLPWSSQGYTKSLHTQFQCDSPIKSHHARPLLPSTFPPSPLSPGQGYVTLLSPATWLGAFALGFAKTAMVSRRENPTKVRLNS